MKTFTSLLIVAAAAAFLVLPFSFEFTGALVFVGGLVGLLVADYARPKRLRLASAVTPLPALVSRRASTFPLAA
ncbi:hypothetical protein [Opitutus terrae]|uniref:Uncharacterized protein n=1 Tax=Opitutus terrae (strain DSM 11246 / JCM 15787 / PB90-1) TaxID=452637 RepID=B1ZTL2_OPITP|nr:hypothetical protein [Opitutus terrae]ACB73957.1 hypothetical protein Oter_0668 [Opitutus terrae PB90-1]